MAHRHARTQARRLWDGQKTIAQIARVLGVHRNTVSRWRRADGWPPQKQAAGGEVKTGQPADSRGQAAGAARVARFAAISHPDLSEQQQIALRAILNGSSYTNAAAAAGVSRGTLTNWRHHTQHRPFQQALRTEQDRTWIEHRERLDALRNSALDVLADMLGQPDADPRIALSILDRTGLPASKEVTHRDESSGRDPDLVAMSSDELRRARLRLVGGAE